LTTKSRTAAPKPQAPTVETVGVGPHAAGHAEQTGDVHREERDVEEHEHEPEVPAAEPLVEQAARDLREPVIEGGEEREENAADEHVMEVRDDEVRVVRLPVERHRRQHHAREPAEHEDGEKADDEQQGRVPARPPHADGGEPGEDLDAVRNGDHHGGRGEERERQRRQAGGEHVVHPQPEAHEGGGDDGEHHERVTDHGAAGERLHDVRDHADGRHEHDVDLGVAEHPEDVLPEQRLATELGVEEARDVLSIELEHRGADDQRREREDDHDAGDQHRPRVERQPRQRHAGRAHAQHADDQLGGRAHGGHLGHAQADVPEVEAEAGRVLRPGERHVGEPAAVRRQAEDEAREDEEPAEEVRPEAERGHARERQLARAQHQRQHVGGDRLEERDDEQEHHGRPVHREELIVGAGVEHRRVRPRELQAHDEGHGAGGQEEGEGRDHVALRQRDVLDGLQHADRPARVVPRLDERLRPRLPGAGRGHQRRRCT
jgi:hypothetical protein